MKQQWPQLETEQVRHEQELAYSRFASYMEQSAKYGQLLVTNLLVINGGALLIFPNLLDKLRPDNIDRGEAVFAAVAFVFGLLLAAASAYSAYVNFGYLAVQAVVERQLEEFKLKCTPTMLENAGNMKTIATHEAKLRWYQRVIAGTTFSGNTTGLGSMVAFIVGCYYVKAALT